MRGPSHRETISAVLSAAVLLLPTASPAADPRFELEVEGGAVWQTKNNVQIPNDASATRFSLADLAGEGPRPAGRVYLTWNVTPRHGLRALAAPFRIEDSGVPAAAIRFAGESFAADVPTDAVYRFDSWRLTYRYRVARGPRARWWIGFTAKVRGAEVELRQGERVTTDTNVGFVPLLHVAGDVALAHRWRFLLDVDALAGGPGRAIDGVARIGFDVTDAWRLTAGYRTLEGGADVPDVYTFAWLHYAVVSSVWRFGG
jgi:hypothetical protein